MSGKIQFKYLKEYKILVQVQRKLISYDHKQALIQYHQPLGKKMDEHRQLINDLVSSNQSLQPVMIFDPVTQIAHRKTFDEYLNIQWKQLDKEQSPLSLLLCNFDFSLQIDNTLQDKILQQVAQVTKSITKRSGDFVARYENYKFAIILPKTDSQGAIYLGKLMREQVEQVKLNNPELTDGKNFSLSIGVATIVPSKKMIPQSLIDLVEQAIYKSKLSGKG
ncbi:MAG: diguanylate cyclase [Sphaerospermopsis sp. SIO1G1]|nr:diguanylate cyclase [Sphaerospermopsis sp. SIO1G1]